jgi:hypothetical protein
MRYMTVFSNEDGEPLEYLGKNFTVVSEHPLTDHQKDRIINEIFGKINYIFETFDLEEK